MSASCLLLLASCLLYAAVTLSIFPWHLAYFNVFAGGPDGGHRFLADSNTDWGQGLRALAHHQARNDLGTVRLSMFTFLDPAAYGVRYEPIAPMQGAPPVLPRRFNPAPGVYAISATTLDGIPLPLPAMYDWFRHREPEARVARVLLLYDVDESPGRWVAQCVRPVAPLPPEIVAEGFGSDALRQIAFDCEQSWLFPDGGRSAGWFVRTVFGIDRPRWPTAGARLEWWGTWVERLGLDALRLSYVQPTRSELPPFAIWEWTGAPVIPSAPMLEVTLEETLTFLGFGLPERATPGTTADVLTYWRVERRSPRLPSLMLHLSGADGVPVAVGDGLGVPIDVWQPGDVIVQRHSLAIPAETPPGDYALNAGVYWLDTLERWTEAGAVSPPVLSTALRIE